MPNYYSEYVMVSILVLFGIYPIAIEINCIFVYFPYKILWERVPTVAQQHQWYFWITGTQVWFLALYSGLRIQCCCGLGCKCGTNLIPGLELHMPWGSQKRKKKKILWEFFFFCKLLKIFINLFYWIVSLLSLLCRIYIF